MVFIVSFDPAEVNRNEIFKKIGGLLYLRERTFFGDDEVIVEFHCAEPHWSDAREVRLSLKKYGVSCRFEEED